MLLVMHVMLSCRQVGFPRTFKEMEAVVAEGSIKDIKRCYRLITKQMDEKMEMVTPADYVRRFCSHLGLTQRDMKAAEEMAEAAVPRNPAAAGCVHLPLPEQCHCHVPTASLSF